jgi:hypothetical protein
VRYRAEWGSYRSLLQSENSNDMEIFLFKKGDAGRAYTG